MKLKYKLLSLSDGFKKIIEYAQTGVSVPFSYICFYFDLVNHNVFGAML